MQSLPAGGMMAAVLAPVARVMAAVESSPQGVSIAAFNGPENVVISGDGPLVQDLVSRFRDDGIRTSILATSHAFHSPHMDPILGDLRRVAETLKAAAPSIPVVSNLTGVVADAHTWNDPEYWCRHARSPVQFGIRTLSTR